MKKLLCLIFVLFLVPVSLFSQKIFREGYIIKYSGEKLDGLVEYIKGNKVPSICVFKRFDIAMEIRYTAGDIRAFGYKNGNVYESAGSGEGKSFVQTVVLKEVPGKGIASNTIRTDAARTAFGVIGGINMYILKIMPETKYYLPDPDSEKSTYFGVSYERLLSRRSDKLSLYAEAGYLRQTFYSYILTVNSADRFIHEDAFIDFSAVKIPVMLRYSFGGVMITPYVNAGISGAYFIDKRYLHIKEEERYGGLVEITEDNDLVFSFFEISATAGAGLKLRVSDKLKLNLEGRMEVGNGLFNNSKLNRHFKEKSIQTTFLIGINF